MTLASGRLGIAVPVLVLVAAVLAATVIGPVTVTPGQLLAIIGAKLTGAEPGSAGIAETVIWQIRLPRVGAALVVGAALAAAGAAYQGLFRNPLVSPDILGVSAGASLGAVLGIFLRLPVVAIEGMAFLGGLVAVAAVAAVAATVRRHDPLLVLVLAGVAVGTLLGAAVALLKVLADPYDQLPAITYWLLGSLAAATPADLWAAAPPILLGLGVLLLLRWQVNLLTLSEEEARGLGVNTRWLRATVVTAATLITAASVAIAGVVGWIGLVIPHAARLLVGPDFGRLLPAAALLGAGYLVAVDTLARSIAAIEVPLGILTAAIGAPVFIWLLARTARAFA
jgi:iron complex transport system permease protein